MEERWFSPKRSNSYAKSNRLAVALSIYHGRSWPELLGCIELAVSLAVKWAHDQSFNGLGSGSTQKFSSTGHFRLLNQVRSGKAQPLQRDPQTKVLQLRPSPCGAAVRLSAGPMPLKTTQQTASF